MTILCESPLFPAEGLFLLNHGLKVDELLAQIPNHLAIDCKMFLNRSLVERAPLFADTSTEFIRAIVAKLKTVNPPRCATLRNTFRIDAM